MAEEIAKAIAEEFDAYLTPAVSIGQSEMWLEFPLPKDRYPKGKTMREVYPSGSMGH